MTTIGSYGGAIARQRAGRWMCALLGWSLMVAGATLAQAATNGDAPAPNFTRITWLSDCEGESAKKYFFMDLLPDGLLRYEGLADVKILGVRTEQISSATVKQLRSATRDLLAGKAAAGKDDGGATFCLRAQIYKAGKMVKARSELIRANQPPAALRRIDELASPKKWACPARQSSRQPGLRSAQGLKAAGYCYERPAFMMTAAGKSACGLLRYVDVYQDGTVYVATYGQRREPARDHSYYQIGSAAVENLVDTINTFEASTLGFEQPGGDAVAYFRRRPEDVEMIKSRLSELVGADWVRREEIDQCQEPMGSAKSSIALRRDLDRAPNDHAK